ncbi:MAG: FAD-dependent oxidoreductase [bacterium]|nr:FAD-dependent oxidoreductase [bacterium]
MTDPRVVIIGAGLAGLTAGRALGEAGVPYVILEAADRPGGLCRTRTVGGYTFDYTGHLLHLKEGQSRDLIMELVGGQLAEHGRRASIFVEGTFVPYPIQAHFGFLPAATAKACLEELKTVAGKTVSRDVSFDEWAEAQFGGTLSDLFMIPYNRKLYGHPLEEMEVSWTSWSIPRPTADEIERIAAGGDPPSFGYNATFFYPGQGGIELLPRCLAAGQEEAIRTGVKVTGVDAARKVVTVEGGGRIPYRSLVSTMPLPDLLAMTTGLPSAIGSAAGKLRASAVLGVCLGLDGPVTRDDHWIYFPDKDLPFYRVGFPSNFSDHVAPAGCGSLYAEAAFVSGSPPDAGHLFTSVVRTLKDTGIIPENTGVAARVDLAMPCAYVFHDRFRARELPVILSELGERQILSVGRYGGWEYSAMQDAVQWGLDAAREVLARETLP